MLKSDIAVIIDGTFFFIRGVAPHVLYGFCVVMTKEGVSTITEDLHMLGKFCLLRSVKNPKWFYGGK